MTGQVHSLEDAERATPLSKSFRQSYLGGIHRSRRETLTVFDNTRVPGRGREKIRGKLVVAAHIRWEKCDFLLLV